MALDRERLSLVARYAGPLLTLLMIGLTEIAAHGIAANPNLGVLLFLLALVPIAYSALKGGFLMGAASTALLTLYTPHYVDGHATYSTSPESIRAVFIVVLLGLGMAYPMSRVKRREDRFREALQARARELEARNRDLVEANAALEAFGYVVSHDLKEPVRALHNYLEAAGEEWPSDESRQFLSKAQAANERLSRLLHGLLEYSRTSSGHTRPAPADIEALVRSDACATQYQDKLRERGGEVVVEGPLPLVVGDEVVLCQLLGNVILNAVKHNTRPAPRVVVRSGDANDGLAHIVVADDGPGFPADVLARFSNLRSNRPATIKAGFGLVIAHRAAQRMGGRIWLENPPSGGAAVHVELPRADEAAESAGLRESRSSPAPPLHHARAP